MPRKTAILDVITQTQIKQVSDLDLTLQGEIYELRRRLFAGATVEPGGYSLNNEDRAITPLDKPFPCHFALSGLDLTVPNAMNPPWARNTKSKGKKQ